ncbi:hypothetical protein LTR84_012593 [Exophiala bonariae]|uniref:3-beta hydroxysteroid dehydrogenase/isomerase domain-containing protein n=1 Tax=Exophiala bonariae TaxID=1690606 RepID=A0AAV9NET5_9EURO|nr:hypothetical protein LTR84_012593 [Exophiala bonariae]
MNLVEKPFGVVLLIGGGGFIAHHIINDIVSKCGVARAEDVHIYDLNISPERTHHNNLIPLENHHQGDICDSDRLGQVLHDVRPSVIFDLVSPAMFLHDLAFYMRINVEARRVLLDLARETCTVKAFVFNSSAGVIHDSYSDLPNADESRPVLFIPQQREPYSHSKAVAETMVLAANGYDANNTGANDTAQGKWKMLTVAIRQCTPFGANHAETTVGLVENARKGKYRFQIGDNTNLVDWTYIENSARAFSLAAQALLMAHESPDNGPVQDETARVAGEAFLVSNDQPIAFWTFVRMVGEAAGHGIDIKEVKVIPRWAGMTMAFVAEWSTWLLSWGRRKSAFTRFGVRYSTINKYCCIDKAKTRLKYQPWISVEEGVRRSVLPYLTPGDTREHGD